MAVKSHMSQVNDVNVEVEAAAVAEDVEEDDVAEDVEEAVELELFSRSSQRFLCFLQAPVLHVHFITHARTSTRTACVLCSQPRTGTTTAKTLFSKTVLFSLLLKFQKK